MIYNEEGELVNSINLENQFIFSQPHIIFDIFKPKEREPEIVIINPPDNLSILKEIRINLYGIPINKRKRWAPRQKYIFYLREVDIPADDYSKIITKLPLNHYLEIDKANKKVRLRGNCISPGNNKTEWINF